MKYNGAEDVFPDFWALRGRQRRKGDDVARESRCCHLSIDVLFPRLADPDTYHFRSGFFFDIQVRSCRGAEEKIKFL